MEANQEVLRTYVKNCNILDAYIDVFSANFTKIPELISTVVKIYNKKEERLLKDPVTNRMYKEIDDLVDFEERNKLCAKLNADLLEFTDLFVQSVLLSVKAENDIEYFDEEAHCLANAYESAYDEDCYIEVEDKVFLAREKRILSLFEKLPQSEIEKEYLLLYNVYNSRCSYIQALVERIIAHKGFKKAIKITADTMDALNENFKENGVERLENLEQETVRKRKERFLEISATMSRADLEVCYKEMCDIMLGKMVEAELYLLNLRQICDIKEYELIQSETKDFIDLMHFPERAIKNKSVLADAKAFFKELFNRKD